MAVLDGERLVGICSRHRLSELLGGRYGFALWARKPIGMHLSPHETRVSVKTPIENVLRKVFARTDDAFYDDVLLVDERESFLGLITTQTLFKVQNALLRTTISALVDKEHEIRSKNEQMETDLRMAMELQQALMSFNYPQFCGDERELRFSHRYRPASMVGGDFFFIGRISDSCAGIFICDVMGHGVRSALITSMLRALIEALGPRAAEPDFLLTELNGELASILRRRTRRYSSRQFIAQLTQQPDSSELRTQGIPVHCIWLASGARFAHCSSQIRKAVPSSAFSRTHGITPRW
jgi:hypothetical protein